MDKNFQFNQNQNQSIHIGLGFDNNYIVQVYTLLTSIFHNNRINNIIFHVIATGVNDTEKLSLINFVRDNNSDINFYEINEDIVRANVVIPDNSHFTIATYYRLYFPTLLSPNISKLLYLDTDIVVIGNLNELYNIHTGDFPIGAVPDSYPHPRLDLGIKGKCFNGGVLLIDTKNWREQKVSENAFEYLRKFPENILWADQDALNATLIGRWKSIDIKYNFTLSDVKLQVPAKELIKDVVIVHYTSYRKPWLFLSRNKLRYLYHYYLKMSPKSKEKRYTDFKWDIKSLWNFMRIRIKEYYFNNKIEKILPIKKWMELSHDPYSY
ncbi:MAG TPA: glycosyltransferase family 8 protein [Segetibacter sp.]|jgi:lipopolysaccharide biosynthesis glycosyltransferase